MLSKTSEHCIPSCFMDFMDDLLREMQTKNNKYGKCLNF
jgi:hypothetical protein